MTASNLIRSARRLITPQGNWCTHYRARDHRQNEVRPDSEAARRWSMDGALLRCADLSTKEGQGDYHQAVQYLKSMFKGSLAEFNDRSEHLKILQYMDRAAVALHVEGRLAA